MPDQNTIMAQVGDGLAVEIKPAGHGTRFMAWVIDQMIFTLVAIFAILALLILSTGQVLTMAGLDQSAREGMAASIALAIVYLILNFLMVLFWGLQERMTGGQTVGKRAMKLRVLGSDGLPASPGAIWMRSLFRIVDHFPLAWLVPAVSQSSKRLGDMVAGTVVVSIATEELSATRQRLAKEPNWEPKYLRDPSRLSALKPEDYSNIERMLDRLSSTSLPQQVRILRQVAVSLGRRLDVPAPEAGREKEFLEEILRWEYRRRSRRLG